MKEIAQKIPFLLVAIILSLALFLGGTNTEWAYAAEQEDGFKLENDYQVKIVYSQILGFGNGIKFSYEVVFDDDFYMATEDKKGLINSVKETFVNNGFKVETDEVNGKMKAERSFDTLTDYYIAMGEDGYSENKKSVPDKKTFFYSYYSSTSKTVFADLKTEGRYVYRIYKACSEAGLEDDKMTLYYVYGTPYGEEAITSTANSVRYASSERIHYHTFVFAVEERDNTVTIYQKSPNVWAWYLMAIVAAVVVAAIPLAIVITKRRKEKNNG